MARNIVTVTISGTVGKEPELKHGDYGSFLPFSLAVKRSIPKGNNEWEEITDWYDVNVNGKTAEGVAKNISSGSKVTVYANRLSARSYTNNNGETISTVVLHAWDVDIHTSKKWGEGSNSNNNGNSSNSSEKKQEEWDVEF